MLLRKKSLFSNLIYDKKLLILSSIFIFVHLFLFNINASEWGDSFRILRAAEFIKTGSYPLDEKRPPFLALVLASRPSLIDAVTYGRLVLFVFSLVSFISFYTLAKTYIKDEFLSVWVTLAFIFNNIYLYWSIRVMTDVVFSSLVLVAFLMLAKWRDSLTSQRLVLIGFITGFAILTRFEGYLLLASIVGYLGLLDFKFDFKSIGKKILSTVPFLFGSSVIILPFLVYRNPFTSSYFEEPLGRVYDLKMFLTYFVSLISIFNLLPLFALLTQNILSLKKFFITNKELTFFIVLELILILSWPAAIPRLFVPLVPIFLILSGLILKNHFSTPLNSKNSKVSVLWMILFTLIYIIAQYYLKLQFLILDKPLFVLNMLLQLYVSYLLYYKKQTSFANISIIIMILWSYSIINMHKDIFISIKNAASYASHKFTGKFGYNDVSSVSDWYLNYSTKNSSLSGVFYNTEKKVNLEVEKLQTQGLDYLLITNEHNTTMTLDLNKRPYLKELNVFEYEVNGKKFVTRIVKIL